MINGISKEDVSFKSQFNYLYGYNKTLKEEKINVCKFILYILVPRENDQQRTTKNEMTTKTTYTSCVSELELISSQFCETFGWLSVVNSLWAASVRCHSKI